MKIVLISDTHGLHEKMLHNLPEGDMIIAAGDISNRGLIYEINQFTEWFSKLPYKYKIFIAGNHDFGFEKIRKSNEVGISIPHGVIYLQDEMVEIEGLKIYGSPWQPEFHNWAFNLPRNGDQIKFKWEEIPNDTDILITHGPSFECLDITPTNQRVGCELLKIRLDDVKPKLHVFGHIHGSYGMKYTSDTLSINACICNERYQPINKPIVVEVSEVYGEKVITYVDND
jgi:Icc-related predicted phosphoesterase